MRGVERSNRYGESLNRLNAYSTDDLGVVRQLTPPRSLPGLIEGITVTICNAFTLPLALFLLSQRLPKESAQAGSVK